MYHGYTWALALLTPAAIIGTVVISKGGYICSVTVVVLPKVSFLFPPVLGDFFLCQCEGRALRGKSVNWLYKIEVIELHLFSTLWSIWSQINHKFQTWQPSFIALDKYTMATAVIQEAKPNSSLVDTMDDVTVAQAFI